MCQDKREGEYKSVKGSELFNKRKNPSYLTYFSFLHRGHKV